MRSKHAVRATLLVLTVALVTGCGNRNDYEALQTAATGAQVAGPAVPAPGGTVDTGAGGPAVAGGAGAAPATVPPAVKGGEPAAPTATPAKGTKAGTPASGAGQAPTGPLCTKPLAPIKIGSVGHFSGVAGALVVPGLKGLQAWVAWTNATKGGVNCHPVELVVGDDGTDPATTQSLVRDFHENRGVIAFVHMGSIFTGGSVVQYLTERRIPVIGDSGGSEEFNKNETYFPQKSTALDYNESAFAMAGALDAPKGLTKVALVTCLEAPICSVLYGAGAEMAKKYGLELPYKAQVSITAPNYTSNCLAAKNAGAQIMFLGLDGNTDQRLARSCEAVGYHPVYVGPSVLVTPSQAAFPALAGMQVSQTVLPSLVTGNKAMQEFLAGTAKYAPGLEASAAAVGGWVSGLVFGQAAAKVGDQPAKEQILEGAFAIKNNNFGGIARKLTYKKGAPNQRQPDICWWALEYNGPKVISPNDGKETCR